MENQLCGVFANRTHEIISIHKCLLQNERTEEMAKFIFDFIVKNKISIYDEKTGNGLIRHIVTKIGIKTNEIMCVIVINGRQIPKEKELVTEILSHFPEVKTIIKNSNMKNTNVILGQENVMLHGSGYIQDKLGEYCFKISPLSFYQVNPMQAEKLYLKGVEAANISKKDVVFDLYCGIGTISLFMSSYAKKVYGIEIVKEAVDMAKENAKLNQVDNVEFIAGDVEEAFDDLLHNRKIIPDIVMVDPPRKGLDQRSVENILAMRPKRLVYISCNPATLVRDLAKMEELYTIKRIEPVDMFPFTSHVECVAVLQLKQGR
jgi:23S rRNA (uracil1939-C5)-methyltransferase